jgi:hypothetical protein
MATKKKEIETIDWLSVNDGEARLEALRARDLEITRIAQGLSMRQRITEVEAENARLELKVKALAKELDAWKRSSTFRLARIFVKPLSIFKRS